MSSFSEEFEETSRETRNALKRKHEEEYEEEEEDEEEDEEEGDEEEGDEEEGDEEEEEDEKEQGDAETDINVDADTPRVAQWLDDDNRSWKDELKQEVSHEVWLFSNYLRY